MLSSIKKALQLFSGGEKTKSRMEKNFFYGLPFLAVGGIWAGLKALFWGGVIIREGVPLTGPDKEWAAYIFIIIGVIAFAGWLVLLSKRVSKDK